MKKLLFLLAVILIHGNVALAASNNFLNKDWWKTATLEDVKKELKNGADVNAANDNDLTVLMYAAAFNSNPKVIETLIDKGANVNAKSKKGNTALFQASLNPNPKVIETLIDAGADVKAKNDDGNTALMGALISNKPFDTIKMLVDEGADVKAKNDDGNTVLMLAVMGNNSPETIKMLIDEGADVNAKNNDGATVLMLATSQKNPDVIKALLKAEADVNAKSNDGFTALMLAAQFSQDPKVVETLIDEGADVNAKNNDGATVLMLAAMYQKIDAVKALLKAGADANVIADNGNIAAVGAALNKNPEVHSLILQAMDIEGYCKLTKNNSFDIGLCIDEMNVYAQKEYMLPDCTHNMPAMLYLTPIINAFSNNAPNERKIIGWLTLAESAKRFNCSLGKTMYITMGGEDFNKKTEQERKELQQITKKH